MLGVAWKFLAGAIAAVQRKRASGRCVSKDARQRLLVGASAAFRKGAVMARACIGFAYANMRSAHHDATLRQSALQKQMYAASH
jgi:hypothetical protein